MADKLALTQNRKARERAKRSKLIERAGKFSNVRVEDLVDNFPSTEWRGRLSISVDLAILEAYLAGYRSRRAEERRERKA